MLLGASSNSLLRLAMTFIVMMFLPASAQVPTRITASDAHNAALDGAIVLIDIRTPEEWRATGVPASGHAISMHQAQADFLKQLEKATGGSKSRPIAVICAVGNRSSNMQAWMLRAGYTAVSDVAEGMMGGRHGAGWIKSGLPVRRWSPGATSPEAGPN